MSVAHLSVSVPHTALEKWKVEKEHKNNKENVVTWFPFFFTFIEFSFLSLLCLLLWLSFYPGRACYRQPLKGQLEDVSASLVEG